MVEWERKISLKEVNLFAQSTKKAKFGMKETKGTLNDVMQENLVKEIGEGKALEEQQHKLILYRDRLMGINCNHNEDSD